MSPVRRVAALWRYPVKSMAGEALPEAEVGFHGVAGDRRWAFVRPGLERSDFPWMTIRERSDMLHYRPSFEDPSRPDDSRTLVETPSGRSLDVADPALAEDIAPGVRVIKLGRGAFDAFPLSLISRQSVAALSASVGRELAVERFRANVVVDVSEPFEEESWIGRVVVLGGVRMRIDARDSRCVITNVDPETAERDPRVLKTIGREREACMGVYGSVVEPGVVAVGDPVTLVT